VLYALGCTERWPVAREVWSGMILAMLVGFVTFSAFALLYPYQLMLSPINYEEAQREEFERLRGEWTLVSSEQAGSTISVQPSNADILRFEQTIEIRKESQAGKKSKSKRDDLPRGVAKIRKYAETISAGRCLVMSWKALSTSP